VAYEFKLPDLGEGVAEGEIARWLVEVGQEIAEDDPLVEIQTDKTTVEIPSPAEGVVSRILVAEGEIVPVGTPLVVIGAEGDGRQEAPQAAEQPRAEPAEAVTEQADADGGRGQTQRRVQTTPLVRRVAGELGVDLASLHGSGPGGRITEEDVRAAASAETDGERGQTQSQGRERRVPLRGVRRRIAEHLTQAHREVPAVTVVEECDLTALGESRGERSFVAYLLEATVAGLKAVPELNARLDGDEIVVLERYDLGVAVQTDEGLVVPVLRDADAKTLDELDAESRRLAEAAHAGSLKPEELRGSTFTVTSAGRHGGLFATPLVNYPEVGILGLHRIADRPAVVGGEIAIRKVGWLSCTFDHRVVDGMRASEFILSVIERLESPAG
jgi:pyruvate/2-oxoglutarate dehydrogenase complex dihydrolipoamide acyltransferase (E2) component